MGFHEDLRADLKDLILELRSKQILSAMLIFALLVVVVFAFAFQPARETTWQVFRHDLGGLAFAAVVGLNRLCGGAPADCLMGSLAPLEPVSIYFGKVLGSLFDGSNGIGSAAPVCVF